VLVDVGVDREHGVAAGGEVTGDEAAEGGLAAAALADEGDSHGGSGGIGSLPLTS
jgi:hypothetical protein